MNNLSKTALLVFATFSIAVGAVPGTRGLENSGLDEYVSIIRSEDLAKLARWFDRAGYLDLSQFVRLRLSQNPKSVALGLANRIFVVQQAARTDRTRFVLLQTLIEETVMYSGVQTAMFTGETHLSHGEWSRAGRIRGVRVVPGDTIVQIGGGTLSSQFIAHSQSRPGIASHSLVVAKGGERPEILEALIEDGTNRREPYKGALARFFVLSARSESERQRVGAATDEFITDMKIPYNVEGGVNIPSPLFYDSTMNPERKKEGYYFCTAVVQEVYSRSGISANPFPENKSTWNVLDPDSIEQGLYHELNINGSKVPAPGDALLNPDLGIRALVLDTAALKNARRLRAVIDGFFDILYSRPEIRAELLALFRKIPTMEVRKAEIIAAFDRLSSDGEVQKLVGAASVQSLQSARAELEKSLPQTANLRQLAFFMIMNEVIQDRALMALENFENETLKRHALPGELRAAATEMLMGEIEKLRAALAVIAKASAPN